MDSVVDKVRSRVLDLVSRQADQYDEQDVTAHIRTRDGLIRMFCERFSETHVDQDYDIEAISQSLIETLSYRKSISLSSWVTEDFPKEIWESGALTMFQDDEYNVTVYYLRNYFFISKKWSDVWSRFFIFNHNKDILEAAHSGRKSVALVDANGMGYSNLDITMFEDCFRKNDRHFPCLYKNLGMYGIPRFMHSIAEWVIRYCMPAGFRKRFRIYDQASLRELLDAKYIPPEMGGLCVLSPPIDTSMFKLKSVKDHGQEWGLGEWEVRKIMDSSK